MADSKRSHHLEAFFKTLEADWKGRYRKFPDQAIYSLQDDRVVAAIEKRFAARAAIREVYQLDYDFRSGLLHLVFEFTPSPDDLGTGGANALLVILDGNCKVIAVVDPFDPVQPNKFVPPLPKESEEPFVLDRPSASKHVTLSDQALYPLQVRSRAFFERLLSGGSGVGEREIITYIAYPTWTPTATFTDWAAGDCGEDEGVLA